MLHADLQMLLLLLYNISYYRYLIIKINKTISNDAITIPVAKEILFFLIERKKIKRFDIAPKLINPPNFP